MSKTITSVLGSQQHELILINNRKLLVIYGKAAETSFAIIPGWYVGNEKYEGSQLTAVDVELVDLLEQMNIEELVKQSLQKKGQQNTHISFWGARGFSQSSDITTPEGQNKAMILVVDDDPGIRDIVKIYLERRGYSVVTASSTNQAIGILKSQKTLPSLMLLDIMMPGSTGWQLLKDLENDPQFNKLPVIAISGLERPNDGNEYDSKMLYDYLVKPFSMEELSRVVRKFSNQVKVE